MCIYIYIYTWSYICIYIYIYIHVSRSLCIYKYIGFTDLYTVHVHIHAFTLVDKMHAHSCMYADMNTAFKHKHTAAGRSICFPIAKWVWISKPLHVSHFVKIYDDSYSSMMEHVDSRIEAWMFCWLRDSIPRGPAVVSMGYPTVHPHCGSNLTNLEC